MKLPEEIKVVLQSLGIIFLSLIVTFFAFMGCAGFIINEPLVAYEFGQKIILPSWWGVFAGVFFLALAVFLELMTLLLTQDVVQAHSSRKHSRISKGIFMTLPVLPALLLTLVLFQFERVRAPAVGAGVILAVIGVLLYYLFCARAR